MKIAVIGSGYVGLVAGAGFSDFGNHVTCVDIDPSRIERLRRGEIPFHEPGLSDLVQRNVRAGRLAFTTDTVDGVREAEVVFLAVGTPSLPDGSADLRYVLEAARQVGLRVPHDLSVVGFDDTPVVLWSAPPLTTVAQNMTGLGRVALRTLVQLAAGELPVSHRIELATSLVQRQSTAPPSR